MTNFLILLGFVGISLGQSPSPVSYTIRYGPTLPVSCRPSSGNLFEKTANPGAGLYSCATGSWVLVEGAVPVKTFSSLGTPADGAIVACSDCQRTNPCVGSGDGATAQRINGAWQCNQKGSPAPVAGNPNSLSTPCKILRPGTSYARFSWKMEVGRYLFIHLVERTMVMIYGTLLKRIC